MHLLLHVCVLVLHVCVHDTAKYAYNMWRKYIQYAYMILHVCLHVCTVSYDVGAAFCVQESA